MNRATAPATVGSQRLLHCLNLHHPRAAPIENVALVRKHDGVAQIETDDEQTSETPSQTAHDAVCHDPQALITDMRNIHRASVKPHHVETVDAEALENHT